MAKITNIQHLSTHDGPGARTVVFFKGCNFSCRWCHNPETISAKSDIMLYREKCIFCGNCRRVCERGAHDFSEESRIYNRSLCKHCFQCVENCYAGSLQRVGEDTSVEDIAEEILSHKEYFRNSGGGVTFSGGECMLQIDPLLELLKICKDEAIHTAVDTAGNIPFEFFRKIIPFTDLFLYDIKAIDEKLHKDITGASNRRILRNFEKLVALKVNIVVNVPVIPGYNQVDIERIKGYLEGFPVEVNYLPYNELGLAKREALK